MASRRRGGDGNSNSRKRKASASSSSSSSFSSSAVADLSDDEEGIVFIKYAPTSSPVSLYHLILILQWKTRGLSRRRHPRRAFWPPTKKRKLRRTAWQRRRARLRRYVHEKEEVMQYSMHVAPLPQRLVLLKNWCSGTAKNYRRRVQRARREHDALHLPQSLREGTGLHEQIE